MTRAWKFPIAWPIRFQACHARFNIETLLEQCIDERGNRGTLCKNNQRTDYEQRYQHWHEPPSLVTQKKGKQLADYPKTTDNRPCCSYYSHLVPPDLKVLF